MKRVIVNSEGDVRCPYCKARNSFVHKRTTRAKLAGATMGGVGIALMPRRLRCNGCGKSCKTG